MGNVWPVDCAGAQLYQARQVQAQYSSGLTLVNSACGIPLVTRFT